MGHQTGSSRSTKTGEGASTTTTTTTTPLSVLPYLLELKQTEPIQIDKPVQMRTAVGTLMTFGKGDHGKLGHGNSTENKRVPTVVSALKEIPLLRIDSLSTHSVAISVDGVLYTWGNGDKHRLGHGTTAKEYGLEMLLLPFFCWCLMIPDTHLLLLFL